MKGANAEAGVHVDHFKKIPLYFAGGPYYLTGKGETTWGGELRTAIDFFDRYLRVEGNVSYDHFFKWIGQAQASVNIPFGKRSKVKKRENFSCSNAIVLETRAIQRVDRNEIIPVVRQNNVSLAINPKTGQPWVFWFVNNTSSSDGTYESPYPTLLLAQNASSHDEVIYVYPGDGTTNGMSNGIALKNAQMLLGASVSHPIPTTVGTVIIPPLASIMPKITNATGDVVTLMNDNVVSGFNITISNGNGLTGLVTSNFMADRNAFSTIANDTNGIFLADASGQIIINDNTFNGFSAVATSNGNGILINLNAGNTLPLTSISGNHFNNISNPAGGNGGNAFLVNVTGTLVSLNASKNSFNNIDSSAGGITLNMLGGTIESTNISDNNFNGLTTGSNGVVLLLNVANSTITSTNITNNTFTTMTGSSAGVSLDNVLGTVPYLNISRNTFNDIRDISRGFTYTSSLGSTSFLSAGNKFTGNAPIPNGYAAIVTVSGGSTCIDFINDSAAPTSAPNPYAFQGLGGTFNRTSGSDNSTNTGQFSIIGVVGAPGSCTP